MLAPKGIQALVLWFSRPSFSRSASIDLSGMNSKDLEKCLSRRSMLHLCTLSWVKPGMYLPLITAPSTGVERWLPCGSGCARRIDSLMDLTVRHDEREHDAPILLLL